MNAPIRTRSKGKKVTRRVAIGGRGVDIIEPIATAQLYEGLKIDSTPMSLTVLVPALAILYGSAFQVGYFIPIGVEFLPHMSVWDIMFPVAAFLPFCFIWMPIVGALKRVVEGRVDDGTFHRSRLGIFTWGFLKLEILAMWVIIAVAVFTGVNLYEFLRCTALFVCLVCATQFASILKHEAQFFGRFTAHACLWFCIHSGFLSIGLGALYAEHFAGKHCWLKTTGESYWDAIYLRGLGDNHLLKYHGRTLLLAKSEVKEILCGKFQPTRAAGEPLKGH
jgi:hypothetical protein